MRRRRKILLIPAALFLLWVGATLALFVFASTDPAGKADAVVVLAGGRNRRLDPALRLMERGVAPVLVISGAAHDPGWTKARNLCRNGSAGFRVICFEPHPYSTRGESEAIARLALARGWQKVDVVTSRYHVFRARMLIRRCYHRGLAMVGTSYPWQSAVLSWVTEWPKLAWQLTVRRSC